MAQEKELLVVHIRMNNKKKKILENKREKNTINVAETDNLQLPLIIKIKYTHCTLDYWNTIQIK